METMSNSNTASFRLDTDLMSLRALVAIADEGTFSAAARRIGRTQSAVSLQIAKLEDRLQVRLLERSSRHVAPTAEGETLIDYARRILALADEAAMALSAPDEHRPLRIGFAEYLAPRHLHELLARFQRAHPEAALSLKLGTGHNLRLELADRKLDLVIAGPDGGTGGRVLFEEPLVWVAADDKRLLAMRPLPLVTIEAPCTYRSEAIDALETSGIGWRIAAEVNSMQGVRSAVQAGLGLSVIARSAVSDPMRIVSGQMPPLPQTAMIAHQGDNAVPLALRFIEYMEHSLRGGLPVAAA